MPDLQSIVQRAGAMRGAASGPGARRAVLAIAAVVLVGGAWFAWTSRPDVETEPRLWALALSALVAVPLHVALNGGELLVMSKISGARMPTAEAARVTVVSSAANLLPLPGAVVVRTRALQRLGSSGRSALSLTVVVGLGWVATACVLAGGLLAVTEPDGAAIAFTVAGAAGLLLTWLLLVRRPGYHRSSFIALIAVEAASTLVAGLRIWLAIQGIGYDASLPSAVALSLASPLASLVGVFPGGVGLREAIAAALGPLVGVPASVSLLATIVDRMIGALVQAAFTVVLLFTPGGRKQLETADEELELAGPPA